MSVQSVLIGAIAVFVFMRAVCEPKLRPGREIWHRVIGMEPADAAVLAGVRFVGTASLLVGLGAGIGVCLTWWVESLDLVVMGNAAGQEAVDRVKGLLTIFSVSQSALSPLAKLVSVVYIILFAVGSLFWWTRSRPYVRKGLKTTVEELKELAHNNKLPPIPSDERMRRVDEAIAAARVANANGGVIEALYARRFQYDIVRRLDPELLREAGEPLPGPRVAAVLRYLISPLLSHQMKRLGRIVSTLSMVVMVPASLVAVASGELNEVFDKKRPVLESLEAALTLEMYLVAAEKVPNPIPPPESPNTKDQSENSDGVEARESCDISSSTGACDAAAAFGTAFEAAWGTSLLDRLGTRPDVARIGDARRAWARRQVLLESAVPRAATVVVTEAASDISDLQNRSQAVMDAVLRARTGSGPVTSVGRRAQKIFSHFAPANSKPIAVANWPLMSSELRSNAFAAALGLGVDGVDSVGEAESTLGKRLFSGTLAGLASDLAKQLHRSTELAAMNEVSRVREATGRAPEPMGAVEVFITPDLARGLKGIAEDVTSLEFPMQDRTHPGFSLESVPRSNVDWDGVETALRQYTKGTDNLGVESLASYSSLFPGIEGQRAQTDAARVARVLNPDGASVIYGAPSEMPPRRGASKIVKPAELTPVAKEHLDLARSFMRLHTNRRVGGVLIGRDPKGATASLDFVGLEFSIEKKDLTFYLTRADGTTAIVGPYDPAIAHLALAYAADARPVTVTILRARPLADFKILLHPALVDTEVGCHAIRLDRFVGQFGVAGLRRNWMLVELYRLALRAQSEGTARASEGVGMSDGTERQALTSVQPTLADTVSIDPVELQPLRERPRFFDPTLVEILGGCLSERGQDTLTQCVEGRTRDAVRDAGARRREPADGLFLAYVHTISGVREDAYELDEDLNFAQVPKDIWDGPLRFVGLNSIGVPSDLEEYFSALYGDLERTWEFPEVTTKVLEEAVLTSVRVETEALQTLLVMQQFTVAQRLFRAAFDGSLGEQFPVERLVEVVRETKPYMNFDAVKTDRWLLRGGTEGTAMQLRRALRVPEAQEATCLGLSGAES